MNADEGSWSDSCINLTDQQFHEVNIIHGTTALICMTVLVLMLLVLCLSKAYGSFVQRLLLYLVVTTILIEMCEAFNFENLIKFSHQEKACTVLGFITNWTVNTASIESLSIMVWTIILIIMHMKCSRHSNTVLSAYWRKIIEVFYLLSVILVPLLIMWMPLKNGNYGLEVAWCWIRAFNESCEDVGFADQMVAGFGIYGAVGVVGILAMIGIIIAHCRLSANFAHVKPLLLQSCMLTLFVVLLLLFIVALLTIRIYSALHNWTQPYAMWLFYGAAIPLTHLIIPLGFFGSLYFKHFRNKLCRRYRRPVIRVEADGKGTAPVSVRQTAPSSTYFNIPYTDGFTNISNDGETTPLHQENTRTNITYV